MANTAKFGEVSFSVGDTVRVFYRIIETEKTSGVKKREEKEEVRERLQPFEGIVLSISPAKTFTIRKIGADNVGVERIFRIGSPWINKVEVKKKGVARRAKLYYLKNRE